MSQTLLEQLDRLLSVKRPDYFGLLQPGATDVQLDALAERFDITLPTAYLQLYRWRNGQDPMSTTPLQGNRLFLTLEEAADTKELLDGMIDADFDEPGIWRRSWLPLLHNGGGSYLCVELAANGGVTGQLIAFWKQDADRPVEFPSLEAWLADLVESLSSNRLT